MVCYGDKRRGNYKKNIGGNTYFPRFFLFSSIRLRNRRRRQEGRERSKMGGAQEGPRGSLTCLINARQGYIFPQDNYQFTCSVTLHVCPFQQTSQKSSLVTAKYFTGIDNFIYKKLSLTATYRTPHPTENTFLANTHNTHKS